MKRYLFVAATSLHLALAPGALAAPPVLPTLVPGTLTVALTDFPYPAGFIEGTDPTAPTGGYYVDMAKDLARRLGLRINWISADYSAVISGQFTDYDLAVDSYTITPARLAKFSMTAPLYAYHQAIVARAGTSAKTAAAMRNLVFGACGACDTYQIIVDRIKPNTDPHVFDMELTKYDALLIGSIDAAVGDLPVILSEIATPRYARLVALCQFKENNEVGWIMPKASPIADAVRNALAAAKSEGRFAQWEKADVVPTLDGLSPANVPQCPGL